MTIPEKAVPWFLSACWQAVALVGLLAAVGPAAGGPPVPAPRPQQVVHTQHADLVYEHRGQVEELARRLGVAPAGPGLPPDVGGLAARIDALLTEVRRVLNRQPTRPGKLVIRLLPDARAVAHQHQVLKAVPPLPERRGPLPSFYEPQSRTIFLSVADARVGIVVHEMTHHVLCQSSGAWPSEAFQESLARYLEERFNTGRSR
jgi:hypothetical protein